MTQLQQDTKGNIFLLLPSCGWCVNHFLSYFYSSFSFFFNFSGCNFKFSLSFSWVASLGIREILPLVINNLSIIGFHFVNKTPVDWYSKKQAETATYGSEFVAAKTATEQIMDIRQTLRYLGAPIGAKSFLFGDNRSVVTSATLPHSTLTKRHNMLAFHRVREAIAVKLMAFYWIQSAYNLSDMLSKHWDQS